ncbi:hypothetical protein BJX70DRAFT_375120 [Aspergillus crustosus]
MPDTSTEMIPSLRSLRLRMPRICPDVLNWHEQEDTCKPRNWTREPRIKILIISLTRGDDMWDRFCHHCTTHNPSNNPESGFALHSEMVMRATQLATRLPRAEMVRIIRPSEPAADDLVHDCITGERRTLCDLDYDDWAARGSCVDPREEIRNAKAWDGVLEMFRYTGPKAG